MSARRVRTDRLNDMLPERLPDGRGKGTRAGRDYINGRWVPRPVNLNETGKLEWLYNTGEHGRHAEVLS